MATQQIVRHRLLDRVSEALKTYPVVGLIGSRQVGKTTLAQSFASGSDHRFDLERSLDAIRLRENAQGILGDLSGIVVIDEAQAMPELFSTLRVLADRNPPKARFIVTGSVSPNLMAAASESLAGRIAWIEMDGFSIEEVGIDRWRDLWLRGGLPNSFFADGDRRSLEVRENYLDSLIGRDLRFWGMDGYDHAYIRRLLMLVADASGQIWKHSEASSNLGVNYKTIQKHISILEGAFLVRELHPFVATTESRLRKAPKLIMRDTGVMHALLRIMNNRRLESHSRLGGSWESFCIQQVIAMTESRSADCFFWNVHGGAEIDLVIEGPEGRLGFEMKHSDSPSTTRSMHTALAELALDKLFVIYRGNERFPMNPDGKIEAVGIENLVDLCQGLRAEAT